MRLLEGRMTTHSAGRRSNALGHAVVHALALSIACLASWYLTTGLLAVDPSVKHDDDLLGGMWAVIATVFVYRIGYAESVRAAVSRGVATAASFVLCLAWLLFLPAGPVGLVVLIGVGTALLLFVGRPDDVVTTGATTAVVMVVAALGPADDAWTQPVLRAVDTAVGITVGLVAVRLARRLSKPSPASNTES
jgi:uncharacterized membrane protein YccC